MGKLSKSLCSGRRECAIDSKVCGPMLVERRGGSYFITFIKRISRFGWIYIMRHKLRAFEKVCEVKNEVEKQFGKSIKTL